jgi:putative SOS response-associated peptidase YedK
MCGRYVLYGPDGEVIKGFSIVRVPPFAPRYNIAPQSDVLVVRADRDAGRIAELARWGLIPAWAKDPAIGAKLINARGETVADKPSFRSAFRRSRCLIPANGFYEWKPIDGSPRPRKQPFYIHPADRQLFAFGGICELWRGSDGPVRTCSIITTAANGMMQPIHERMPLILDPAEFDAWLDPGNQDAASLRALVRPCPDERVAVHAVGTAVSNSRSEGPGLIEPLGS